MGGRPLIMLHAAAAAAAIKVVPSGQALGLVASWLVEKNTNSYVDFYGLVNWLVRRLPFY